MSLSKRSIENLIDLVEIKIGCLQVIDREDARELRHLEVCRRELLGLQKKASSDPICYADKTPGSGYPDRSRHGCMRTGAAAFWRREGSTRR
jgi:hypothetical protein